MVGLWFAPAAIASVLSWFGFDSCLAFVGGGFGFTCFCCDCGCCFCLVPVDCYFVYGWLL